jgi:PAS domain S-box-containing protein
MDFLRQIFGSGDYMPHGYCYLWNIRLVSLHVISDSLIALSYFAIPAVLLWITRKRRDLPFSWMFLLFGVFIVACGMTHVLEVWNLWHANYWLSGGVKAVTAAASVSTAVLLTRIAPQALDLPGVAQLLQSNRSLEQKLEDARQDESDSLARESTYRDQAALLDLTHDAIFVRDLRSTVTYWNHAAERLYGWRKDQAVGEVSHNLLQTTFPKPVREIEADVFSTGYWEGELVHRRRDGTPVVVSSRWALQTNTRGEVCAILESNRDITRAREEASKIEKLNVTLQQKVAELNTLNQELESFSYSVSHDLRAPLRHLDGFARILQDEYASHLPPDAIRYLNRITEAANRMGSLIDDLLALGRIGRKEITFRCASLDEIVNLAMADLPPGTESRSIEWKIGSLGEAECDAGLLKLVFSNLLSNAVKFTRSRQTAVIEIGKRQINGTSAFFVRDNGVGFEPKYADKLFGVFQRLHSQQEFEGTGIGLATVRRIVQRHGGEAWAESERDCGATFLFTLAADANRAAAHETGGS